MEERILEMKKSGDSVGGSIICRVFGLPIGLGAPVFDRIEAELSKAMLSLPATKAFEIGSGFGVLKKVLNTMIYLKIGTERCKPKPIISGVQGGIYQRRGAVLSDCLQTDRNGSTETKNG